jgi:hypothetical protein
VQKVFLRKTKITHSNEYYLERIIIKVIFNAHIFQKKKRKKKRYFRFVTKLILDLVHIWLQFDEIKVLSLINFIAFKDNKDFIPEVQFVLHLPITHPVIHLLVIHLLAHHQLHPIRNKK